MTPKANTNPPHTFRNVLVWENASKAEPSKNAHFLHRTEQLLILAALSTLVPLPKALSTHWKSKSTPNPPCRFCDFLRMHMHERLFDVCVCECESTRACAGPGFVLAFAGPGETSKNMRKTKKTPYSRKGLEQRNDFFPCKSSMTYFPGRCTH